MNDFVLYIAISLAPIIPKNQESARIFCIFFDFRCKDKYKTHFLLVNNPNNSFCKVEFEKSSTKVNINLTICWTLRSNNFNIVCSVAQKKTHLLTKGRCVFYIMYYLMLLFAAPASKEDKQSSSNHSGYGVG